METITNLPEGMRQLSLHLVCDGAADANAAAVS